MGSGSYSDSEGTAGAQLALYRAVWWGFCGAFIVICGAAAALLLPSDILLLALALVPVSGATAAAMYGGDTDWLSRWTRWQVAVTVAVIAGASTLILGLTDVLGYSVLWLVLLLGASSPPAVRWYRGGPRIGRAGLPERSTAELCRQWRDSYDALRRATSDAHRLRIVLERQHCLDELGRRDPEGLQAWLASAASAAGDPERFLKSQ
ncbi:hypothetical protein [Kribbella sp. NPDC050459]|uniref:hypothetical protein n=1 Tax=Kribbella sp. NPDC050459 TaxID=3155785 RepID=UPI0033CE298A